MDFFCRTFFWISKGKTYIIIAPGIVHGSDVLGEALVIIFS
ncbi:MAG: hypothetical protein ACTSUT_12630 [Promethearchaeota archaeon]